MQRPWRKIRRLIQPEQLYAMLDSSGKEAVLSLSDELQSIVGEIREFLGGAVTVTGECPPNICFRMNRLVFRSVVAEMTAECCSSELYPDLLVYAVKRTDMNHAEISVRSVNTSGNSNTAYDFTPREADIRGVNRHVFFDHLCSVLSERYETVFSRSVQPDGILYKMELEVFPKGSSPIARTASDYFSEELRRFGVVAMSLADFCHNDRYYYIDPERIDNFDSDDKE